MPDVVSGYLSMIDEQLPFIIERLRTVQILRRSVLDILKTWDTKSTLFYCDPPYVHNTRHIASRNIDGFELSEDDHRELAEVLRSLRGKVVLSGYPSSLYEDLFKGWRRIEFDIANHAAGGSSKARMKEVLWLNW